MKQGWLDHLSQVRDLNAAALARRPGEGGIVGVKRGSFCGNQRVHDALVRRGLLIDDLVGYTYITVAGCAALRGAS